MAPNWKAPTVMTACLMTACALAVGHHLYYQLLSGSPVSTERAFAVGPWSGVSSQKLHTSIGTAFAFLFKTFLAIAVSVSYVQVLWKALKSAETNVKVVDDISGALGNPLAFLSVTAWRNHALLLFCALVSWLVPIASIITPATLTVGAWPQTSWGLVDVPLPSFINWNFAVMAQLTGIEGVCIYNYKGPQNTVTQVVAAVLAQGAILHTDAPSLRPNASYTTAFQGPALQCADVTGSVRNNIISYINTTMHNESMAYGYVSWVGQSLPEYNSSSNGSPLYVAIFPKMPDLYIDHYALDEGEASEDIMGNATIIQCTLVNTTYDTSVVWINGVRTIDMVVEPSQAAVIPLGEVSCANETTDFPSIVQHLAYQSIMDAFAKSLVGTISNSLSDVGGALSSTTGIMGTVIGNVPELAFLRTYSTGASSEEDMLRQTPWLNLGFDTNFTGPPPGASNILGPPGPDMRSNTSIHDTMEQIFRNITMSLTSSVLPGFNSSPYYVPPTNVTFIDYYNVYEYSLYTLWLSYGVAILLAVIPIASGYLAIASTGLSYSMAFSTFMRTIRFARTSTPIEIQDAVGEDPLPKHLKRATISFEDGGEAGSIGDMRQVAHGRIAKEPNVRASSIHSHLMHDHD